MILKIFKLFAGLNYGTLDRLHDRAVSYVLAGSE